MRLDSCQSPKRKQVKHIHLNRTRCPEDRQALRSIGAARLDVADLAGRPRFFALIERLFKKSV